MVREKSLVIGPLSGAFVCLALGTFLTCYVARVSFVYIYPKQQNDEGHRRDLRIYLMYMICKALRFVFTMNLPVLKLP